MYKAAGSDDTTVTNVRTVPRMWCFDCSIKNAKKHKQSRANNLPLMTLQSKWEETKVDMQSGDTGGGDGGGSGGGGGAAPIAAPSEGGGITADEDVRTAVRVVQLYNPAFGAKRVAQELRTYTLTEQLFIIAACCICSCLSPEFEKSRRTLNTLH